MRLCLKTSKTNDFTLFYLVIYPVNPFSIDLPEDENPMCPVVSRF